ncbi:sigma-70 family RNA polymerase sigma factor [Methylopila sp. M107]|uniref:sigma-70 family RNA polymerase sigma factor n=1 Tax=Methylopila sp. M107 TaxID=1101190 RepID=UPI00037388C4|nr:sigma-70 family RNA polymerase sigma factor [Methylopila sp. M107]
MDETAALLEPLIPSLRRYAYALTRDHGAADDLVQDTLERALSRWYLRRRDGDLRAWLFTIERNLYVSGLRRRRSRGVEVALDDAAEPAVDGGQESSVGMRDLLAALDQLPEDHKSILLLVGVEDLTYEEAAGVLDVPIGTVMSRLSRGRQRLRTLLETGRTTLLRRVK